MSTKRSETELLQRALEREKKARKVAEHLLESKSSELYESNQDLIDAREALEQKVVERTVALRDARDNAVRLMEERTVFLARISHELRTPLNSILGIVQLMLQGEARESERRKLETVNASSGVLLTMINEILDFTKIEAGEISTESIPTDVSNIVDGAVDMLTQTASEKGVALYTQKRAGFPERVATDPSRLQQIVLNLLSNAVKFTSHGSVTVNLDLLEGPSPELVLSFADTGVGVHPDRLENIFQPFKQSDEGMQVHSGGTGLGLSIVQRSAQMLGGDVTVESTLGEGSKFTVRLPIHSESTDAGDAGEVEGIERPNAADSEAASHRSSELLEELSLYQRMGLSLPLRILVADDNQMNRSVMEMQLEYLGYQADYVVNGEEVVRAVLEHQYDVLFLDISMPLMNGEEACAAIRGMANIPQPVIVAVTASALRGDRERYLDSGMDHYLPKPVDSLALAKLTKSIAEGIFSDKPAGELSKLGNSESIAGSVDVDPVERMIDLEEIRVRLGAMLEPMLLKVSPIFIAELPSRIDRLFEAWRSGGSEELVSILHSLKGSAASAGASAMTKICSDLEARARANDSLAKHELDHLARCAAATSEELQSIVERLSK